MERRLSGCEDGILTGWLAVGPWHEFDVRHVALGGIHSELGLQGTTQQVSGDV